MPAVPRRQTTKFGRGSSPGPRLLVQGDEIRLPMGGGMNESRSASTIDLSESPDMKDVRITPGSLHSQYALANLGAASAATNKRIISIVEFQTKSGTDSLIRLRRDGWDWWNGTTWATLTGSLTGTDTDRYYTASLQDKFCAANGVDKIKAWNGLGGGSVADLDTNAPVCRYIAPMGQRLVAAYVKNGSFDPYKLQWSADGDITEWQSALLGAGSVVLEPEGSKGTPDFITGLSVLETALVVYREGSIVLGQRTGVGAQPFRWATVIAGIGSNAPYSIANGGVRQGDFFLGTDLNVYNFNGRDRPEPVGTPIWNRLRTEITSLTEVVGIVDKEDQVYWIAYAEGASTELTVAWGFSIRQWREENKLVWTKRVLPDYTALGFGRTEAGNNPVVNDVTDIVDTVGTRVDSFANVTTKKRLLFGDDVGQVRAIDLDAFIVGDWKSMQFGPRRQEITVDRIGYAWTSTTGASVETSVSVDGGVTWTTPRVSTLPSIATFESVQYTTHQITGVLPQVRIRILSGQVTISEVTIDVFPRARAS